MNEEGGGKQREKTKKIGLSERTALESSKILLERFG
jgi:hypothetical protein